MLVLNMTQNNPILSLQLTSFVNKYMQEFNMNCRIFCIMSSIVVHVYCFYAPCENISYNTSTYQYVRRSRPLSREGGLSYYACTCLFDSLEYTLLSYELSTRVYSEKKNISAISGVHVFNLMIIHVIDIYMYIIEREIDVKGGSSAGVKKKNYPAE